MYARTARGRSLFQILAPAGRSRCLVFFTAQLMRMGAPTVILNSNSRAHTVWRIISRTHRQQCNTRLTAAAGKCDRYNLCVLKFQITLRYVSHFV